MIFKNYKKKIFYAVNHFIIPIIYLTLLIINWRNMDICVQRMSIVLEIYLIFGMNNILLIFRFIGKRPVAYEFESTTLGLIIYAINFIYNCPLESKLLSFPSITIYSFKGILVINLFSYIIAFFVMIIFVVFSVVLLGRNQRKKLRPEGLTHSEMDHVDINIYSKLEEEIDSCAICITDFCPTDELFVLPGCEHKFHSDCIKVWLKINHFCPYCRKNIREAIDIKKKKKEEKNEEKLKEIEEKEEEEEEKKEEEQEKEEQKEEQKEERKEREKEEIKEEDNLEDKREEIKEEIEEKEIEKFKLKKKRKKLIKKIIKKNIKKMTEKIIMKMTKKFMKKMKRKLKEHDKRGRKNY